MLSHQPEVSRLLVAEHVQQLVGASRSKNVDRARSRPVRRPSRLGVVARELAPRTWETSNPSAIPAPGADRERETAAPGVVLVVWRYCAGMRQTTLALALLVLAVFAATGRSATSVAACAPNHATSEYSGYVQRAVDSGRDLWGHELLSARSGPTLHASEGRLAPLLYGVQRRLRRLTPSGFYYVPLSFSWSNYGSTVFALHVADGSEVITRRVGGAALQIWVGNGGERYGSCVSRLQPARLAEGHLPILETSYTDANGVRYRQESFVGHVYGTYGVPSIISFIRVDVDATGARAGAKVRFDPTRWLGRTGPERSGTRKGVRL